MQVRSNVLRLPSRVAKRAFDIAVATFFLIALSPIFLMIAHRDQMRHGRSHHIFPNAGWDAMACSSNV